MQDLSRIFICNLNAQKKQKKGCLSLFEHHNVCCLHACEQIQMIRLDLSTHMQTNILESVRSTWEGKSSLELVRKTI